MHENAVIVVAVVVAVNVAILTNYARQLALICRQQQTKKPHGLTVG